MEGQGQERVGGGQQECGWVDRGGGGVNRRCGWVDRGGEGGVNRWREQQVLLVMLPLQEAGGV